MQGTIEERIVRKGRDANGKVRSNMKVYDVRYRYTDPATGKRKTTRKRGFLRRADAEAFLLKVNQDESDGIVVHHQALLMKDYLTDWMETYVKNNLRPTTYEGYEFDVKNHIIPNLGKYEIKRLTAADIDKFYAQLRKDGRKDGKGGLAEISIKRVHRILSQALKHAVKHNLIARNPVDGVINTPRPKKFTHDIYDDQEIVKLMQMTKGTLFEVPIALGGICGLRRGEILGLQETDIDFERHCIKISHQLVEVKKELRFTAPKSQDSNRTISAPALVFDILRQRMEYNQRNKKLLQGDYHDHGLIVCSDDGMPLSPKNFSARFCNLLKRLKIKRVRFHDLRHSGASMMLRAGVDMKVVSSILGHSSIKITADVYLHILEEMKLDAAAKVEHLIARALDNMGEN